MLTKFPLSLQVFSRIGKIWQDRVNFVNTPFFSSTGPILLNFPIMPNLYTINSNKKRAKKTHKHYSHKLSVPPFVPGIVPGTNWDKPGEIGLPLCKIRRKPGFGDKPGVVPRPTGPKSLCLCAFFLPEQNLLIRPYNAYTLHKKVLCFPHNWETDLLPRLVLARPGCSTGKNQYW